MYIYILTCKNIMNVMNVIYIYISTNIHNIIYIQYFFFYAPKFDDDPLTTFEFVFMDTKYQMFRFSAGNSS